MSEQLFYVQDKRQIVGNCILWWGKNSCGYTTELEEAGLYTDDDIKSMRSTDIAYKKEDIDKIKTSHVRSESLGRVNGKMYEMREIELLKIENKQLKEKADALKLLKSPHADDMFCEDMSRFGPSDWVEWALDNVEARRE